MVTWPPRAAPGLEAAFVDVASKDRRARVMAAEVLGSAPRERWTSAVQALMGLLERDPEGHVRYRAALSLGELRAAPAQGLLVRTIDDRDAQVRQAAVIALAEMGDPSVVPRLIEATRDAYADVRFQAIAAVVQLAPERALPLVLERMKDDDPEVRAQAAEALGALWDEPDPVGQEVRAPLSKALGDSDPRVRWAAALALGEHGDPAGVETLLGALDDDDRLIDAATTLGLLGEKRAIEPLRRKVRRFFGSPILKVAAAGALHRLGDPRGRRVLLDVLRGRRWEAKGYAAELCGDLGIAEARPLLERLRGDPGPLDPGAIEEAITRIDGGS